MVVDGGSGVGAAALRDGRWEDARRSFAAALDGEETAEAHLGMAEACWWLCDARTSVRHRERAWSLLRQQGDPVGAGRVAVDLCIAHLVNLGNDAAARGWLARAERVLRNTDPNPLQGWLWLMQGFMAPDPRAGLDLFARALDFAQTVGDADLELVALSDLGLAKVVAGQVADGIALLDEAMAGTLGGEYQRLDTVVFATCGMLAACHLLGDLDRASKWCRAADQFMATYGCPFLYARCRVHYGGVLVASGDWAHAEEQFQAALAMAEDAGPGPRMEAVAQLADLRIRQGRIEEAEALLDLMDDTRESTLAAAALRMARGDTEVAIGLLQRRVRALGPNHVETPPTLAMLVDALIANGDLASARLTAGQLEAVADQQDRDAARALAQVADARIAVAESRDADAMLLFEDALRCYAESDLPLDAARMRLDLARLLAPTQRELAVTEARRAMSTFARLGASADTDSAAAVLRSLGPAGRTSAGSAGDLTGREEEVFRLVAAGFSNPEIAERLFISRKTASNHVSNILMKLGLRNRTEAAAFVARNASGSRGAGSASAPT